MTERKLTLTTKGGDVVELSKLKTVVTHGGVFHADEISAIALLKIFDWDGEIKRVFTVDENVPDDAVVIDIGLGIYDHHQRDRRERENGIPYAGFGLIWDALGLEKEFPGFDENFVQLVDAADNGYVSEDLPSSPLGSIISAFNPTWLESSDLSDEYFYKAIDLVQKILSRTLTYYKSEIEAETIVKNAPVINNCVVLDKFAPWQKYIDENILGVIYPSLRGGFNIQIANINPNLKELRASFPDEWFINLPEGVTFLHNSGFLLAAPTKELCIELSKYITRK